MIKNSNKQAAIMLYNTLLEASDADKQKIVDEFLEILSKKSAFKQGKKIVEELQKYADKKYGVEKLEIVSAGELDKSVIKKIKSIFGELSEVKQEFDKSLIGGIVVKTENNIFDASIKKQLKNLENILK